MPLPTLAAQITENGISAPSFAQILQSLQESVQAIYGSDVYISPDSQDGQFLALIAKGISDSNQMAIAVYNAFRPTGAQGAGLSSIVKINGLARKTPTNSTAVGNVVGVNGTVINNGVVSDNNGNKWDLPASVTIPPAGFISVTVTAQEPGEIPAPAGSINSIATPTLGWQSFISTTDAVLGDPVESDATLRRRQARSTALPAISSMGGLYSSLLSLPGVQRVRIYENASDSVDSNGIPARSISCVIQGGDVQEIARTIGQKKTPGAGTYGAVTESYIDPITGIPYDINFYVLAEQGVDVQITVSALAGWSTEVQTKIQQSVSDYINNLDIGVDVDISRLWGPAYLFGRLDSSAYEITVLELDGGTINVPIDFNKKATCDPSNVVITVSP